VDVTDSDGLTAGGLLRKMAHFTEFFCLGMSVCWLFQILEQKGIYRFAMPQFCGMLVAFIDETIQLFSPGRAGSVVDVWIDTAGVFAGIVLFRSIDQVFLKKKKTKTKLGGT
jgi:VanZ family protein